MKVDKPALDDATTNLPGEFGQNYMFLSQLIACKEKNDTAAEGLDALLGRQLSHIRGKLNRRQMTIVNRYLKGGDSQDGETLPAPVPAELEASIRIRKRSTWLPWEAEAIRKIDRWRGDIECIISCWNHEVPRLSRPKQLSTRNSPPLTKTKPLSGA